MLSKKAFEDGMMTLMVYYNGFQFPLRPKSENIMDVAKYNVWYEVFKDLTDDEMHKVVKAYCVSNIYAPTSPTPILEKVKELKMLSIESSEQAWEIVEKNLSKGINGYKGLDHNGKIIYVNPFMDEMKKYPLIERAVKDIFSSLASITSDNKSYVRNEFKQVYGRHIESTIQIGHNSQLKIGG
jgi:hypothetical protein